MECGPGYNGPHRDEEKALTDSLPPNVGMGERAKAIATLLKLRGRIDLRGLNRIRHNLLAQRKGQRREPAIWDVRIATRRAGWRPFAGPSWLDEVMVI